MHNSILLFAVEKSNHIRRFQVLKQQEIIGQYYSNVRKLLMGDDWKNCTNDKKWRYRWKKSRLCAWVDCFSQ